MATRVHNAPARGYFPSGNMACDGGLLRIIFKIAALAGVIYGAIKGYLCFRSDVAISPRQVEPVETGRRIELIKNGKGNIEEIQDALTEGRKKAKCHGTKPGIFCLPEVSNIIFKEETFTLLRGKWKKSGVGRVFVETRYNNIQAAKEILKNEKFKHLRVPETIMFETKEGRKKTQTLAQEKFTPSLGRTGRPLKLKDANLTDEAVRELVLFILKTGYFDVDDRNFFIVEGKIAIIDYEYLDSKDEGRLQTAFHGGSINGGKEETISGLFKMLPQKVGVINKVLGEVDRKDLQLSLEEEAV